MEKFCIVKRRRPVTLSRDDEETDYGVDLSRGVDPFSPLPVPWIGAQGSRGTPGTGSRASAADQTVRILLTPDQCKVMSSGEGAARPFGRILDAASVDVDRDGDGRIVLNLHLKYAHGTSMLTVQAACEMLHVSKSFISRLVKEGRIKSYKIGRLRRFLIEDVLDYLSCIAGGLPASPISKPEEG